MGADPSRGRSVALFGAPLDTGNLGVSALALSTIGALSERIPGTSITLFDNGRGRRQRDLVIGGKRVTTVERGAWISRRLYRTESLWSMRALSRGAPWANANLRAIDASDAVLDISGGDSFTDLYGPRRLDLVTLPKRIALQRRRPLLLLPQTYGPFRGAASAGMARDILSAATQAWARDRESYQRLEELLGSRFDPSRHRLGVDVAFSLQQRDPDEPAWDTLRPWFAEEPVPPIGVNVSGLLYNDSGSARQRFELQADYRTMMLHLVRSLLRQSDAKVLLVPHVVGARESDDAAAADLAATIGDHERVMVVPRGLEADQVKAVIARTDWFIGARMHSTIAALSSGVPAAAVAYSDKFAGVFAGCGVQDRVLDARQLDADDIVLAALEAYERRSDDRATIASHLPGISDTLSEQFDTIVAGFASETTQAAR